MNTTAKFGLIASLLFASACGQNEPEVLGESPLERTSQALDGAQESYWPVPGIADANQGFKRTWDGSMSDLLAADALAACWSSIPTAITDPQGASYFSSFVSAVGFGDPAITGLVGKMTSGICPAHRHPPGNPLAAPASNVFNDWIEARKDPACSFDPSTRKGRALDLKESRSSLAGSIWQRPTGVPEAALREAEAELAYADLYLCMTQRLVEHTQSSFVFEASAEEVLQLYDMARNRALLTVFQYSLLAKVFAIEDAQLSALTPAEYGTIAALKHWATKRTAEEQAAAGRDLALAVDTLAELTKKQVELLRRDASRGGSFVADNEARAEMLHALYGDTAPAVSSIQQDLSAPEIEMLLGLARAADALDLDARVASDGSSVTVERESSAQALLRAAERQFRVQQCRPDDAACLQVGENDPPETYRLYKVLGVRPEHAKRLVGALVEALFGKVSNGADPTYQVPGLVAPAVGELVALAGALNATCGLFNHGRVACWGTGLQRGTAPATWVNGSNGKPLEGVVDVVAGGDHACALTENGQVFCWGGPDGTSRTASATAAEVPGLPNYTTEPVRELAAREGTTCAVTLAGRVFCWSSNAAGDGVLGDGYRLGECTDNSECGPTGTCLADLCRDTAPTTARAASITAVRSVTVGGSHVCALRENGEVWCWGKDDRGQLGKMDGSDHGHCGSGLACRPLPAKVNIPSSVGKVVALEASGRATCVLSASRSAYCWGNTAYVGSAAANDASCPAGPCVRTAQQVRTAGDAVLPNVLQLSGGRDHVCALVSGGRSMCWGDNGSGQLGIGNTTRKAFATEVSGGPFSVVAAGHNHTCALSFGSGPGSCWGLGSAGQLGKTLAAGATMSTTPVEVVLPSQPPSFTPPTTTPQARVSSLASNARKPFHLLGLSITTGATAERQRIHVSKDFVLAGLGSHELQIGAALRHIPVRTLDMRSPARGQGFLYRRFVVKDPSHDGWVRAAFEWGSVPTLAVARESIHMTAGTKFFEGASSALDLIDTVAGPKTAILRKKIETWDAIENACTGQGVVVLLGRPAPSLPSDQVLGLCRETRAIQGGGRTKYELSVLTSTDDPIRTVAFGPRVTHALEKAMHPADPVLGSSTADILGTSQATLGTAATVGARELRTAEFVLKSPASIFFEQSSGASRSDGSFLPIFDGELHEQTNPRDFAVLDGAIVAYGGTLNAMAREAFEVQPANWSKPRYDAYGLPVDWIPSADPALLGSSGEEPYQYFLRLAQDTAREATKAIEDAFETTRQEEVDQQALAAANEKGSTLRKQEAELLCGQASCSAPAEGVYHATDELDDGSIEECLRNPPNISEEGYCARRQLVSTTVIAPVQMPKVVWDQRNTANPAFADYEGGELGKRLLDAWTALRRVRDAYRAGQANLVLSRSETKAASEENSAAHSAVAAEQLNAKLQKISIDAQRNALQTQAASLRTRLGNAKNALDICSEEGFNHAVESGRSFSGATNLSFVYYEKPTEHHLPCDAEGECPSEEHCSDDGCYYSRATAVSPAGSWSYNHTPQTGDRPSTWSPGAVYAWQERCEQRKAEFAQANADADEDRLAELDTIVADLESAGAPANEVQLAAGVQAAEARALAAEARLQAALGAEVQAFVTAVGTVQEAYSALLTALKDLALAQQRTKIAQDRYSLDQKLIGDEIAVRQKLRRRYQGFAQWRAEAMAENARRTAVAARRAIESRFAVDLSKMGNDEPFVAPPSVWADDVYDRDLKPPAAVGTTRSQDGASGQLYTNKLLDYVSNLQLFVSGYAIARPTSAARNDAEVITLSAPFAEATIGSAGSIREFMDPDSFGWKFQCSSGQLIDNPAATTFGERDSATLAYCTSETGSTEACPLAFDEAALAQVCNGQPPMRALYRFWMDPWGRIGGNQFTEPFEARHNARWRQLAINLVGTGIRECENALDPDQCYAEPFIRYGLRHVGPALVTSYDLQWHSLEIPSAVVEDGKALAIEEWLDPVSRGWNVPEVQAVSRAELNGRPMGGVYELSLQLTPDVRLSRIERIQLLTSVDYWVRQD